MTKRILFRPLMKKGPSRATEAEIKMSSLLNRKWRDKNPEAHKAHMIVRNAIKYGRIKPQLCEFCGEVRAHAHHDDYSKPLEIRWLCSYHHRKIHKPFCKPSVKRIYQNKNRQSKGIIYPKRIKLSEAIALRAEGKYYKEIATILNVTKATVFKWLNPEKGYR